MSTSPVPTTPFPTAPGVTWLAARRLTNGLRLAGAVALLAALTWTPVDPDLWGHVRFGLDLLESHDLMPPDAYSFTSDREWINHEWLAELAMGWAWQTAGSQGLVLMRLVITLATLGLAWFELRRKRFDRLVQEGLLAAATLGAAGQMLQVRPQVFSVLFFVVELSILGRAASGAPRALWALPMLFALWVNCHGGWLVGMGALGVWCAAAAWSAQGHARLALTLAPVLAFASTALNPHGLAMWQFLFGTVGLSRADVTDWRPSYSDPVTLVVWLLASGAVAVAIRRSARRADIPNIAVVILLGVLSFRIVRISGFFILAIALLTGHLIASLRRSSATSTNVGTSPPGRAAVAALAAAIATVVTASGYQLSRNLDCVSMNVDWVLPEPGATRLLQRSQFQGRLVTWFDWGQYAIWHLGPRLRVSFDGRRETVYSEPFRSQHLSFYFNGDGALDFLRSLDADYIWLPVWLPIVEQIPASEWSPVFRGPRSIVLARSDRQRARESARAHVGGGTAEPTACFPGP